MLYLWYLRKYVCFVSLKGSIYLVNGRLADGRAVGASGDPYRWCGRNTKRKTIYIYRNTKRKTIYIYTYIYTFDKLYLQYVYKFIFSG